jgi:ATP-dependent Clp endopeptidase proteolytic subunit ClpP
MRKPSLSVIKNQSISKGEIHLYGIIGDSWYSEDPLTARKFIKELYALETQFDDIDIHINSPGGDVWEGLAIANAIKASKKNINTYNDGIAASMAATIFCAGKKTYAAKGSLLMIHSASTVSWGNSGDMKEAAEFLDKHDDVLASFFADKSGLTIEEVKEKWFDYKDHYLTAQEAADLNLVDLVETYEAEGIPEGVTNMPLHKVAALYHPTQAENQNQNMFGNKFKNLAALAKVAASAITADQVAKANTEIAESEIEGVTLVLDSELEEVSNKVTNLETQVSEKDAKITQLEATVAEQKAKIDGAAGVPPTNPPAGDDKLPTDKVEDSFETSFDREVKAAKGLI